ncbi:unnamed protein product [Triticum turgidum subsp. durum]|uniref:Methyltransferase n=1 Tax=Triticum turgidum subsp. durum TaxID=4567 RepID=A0A9R0TQP0_TRITD|nr:unnamed protein product [Triticum turgidum subsp. durum]
MDLKLMEHHEHHCPTYERRFNCLIPPPQGYKVSRLSFLSFFLPSPHLNLIMSLSYKVAGVGSHRKGMMIFILELDRTLYFLPIISSAPGVYLQPFFVSQDSSCCLVLVCWDRH